MEEEKIEQIDPKKKKNGLLKYLLYMLFVLLATGISLLLSLFTNGAFEETIKTITGADWKILLMIMGFVFFTYLIEGLIILIFCRLYSRRYKFHQGLASSFIGQFYSDVTPGASGGQVMQAYTLKQQGMLVSNAASIMVMWFILYQTALIIYDVVALVFKWNSIVAIQNININGWVLPLWPLIAAGFVVNISVIFLLLLMSNSHKIHNFILHYIIGFLGKIRIIKNPDKTRESLRVQVENFKIELRRLSTNIPVVLVQLILFILIIGIRNSIPYWAGFAVHAYESNSFDFSKMMDASFTMSFHQMVTGLIPLPGSAGISELFYNILFENFFGGVTGTIRATQIIWRTCTFYIILLFTGIFSAFYKSRPKEQIQYANRQTFVTLQYETYAERKESADTLFETKSLNRKSLKERIAKEDAKQKEKRRERQLEKQRSNEAEQPKKTKQKQKVNKDQWGKMDI